MECGKELGKLAVGGGVNRRAQGAVNLNVRQCFKQEGGFLRRAPQLPRYTVFFFFPVLHFSLYSLQWHYLSIQCLSVTFHSVVTKSWLYPLCCTCIPEPNSQPAVCTSHSSTSTLPVFLGVELLVMRYMCIFNFHLGKRNRWFLNYLVFLKNSLRKLHI